MFFNKNKKNQTYAFDIIDEMEYVKEKTLSLVEMYRHFDEDDISCKDFNEGAQFALEQMLKIIDNKIMFLNVKQEKNLCNK